MKAKKMKEYLEGLDPEDNLFICMWTATGAKFYDIPHIPAGKKVYPAVNPETGAFALIAWIDECPANRCVMTKDGRMAYYGEKNT